MPKAVRIDPDDIESVAAALVEAGHGAATLDVALMVAVVLKRRGWRREPGPERS